MAAVCGPVGGFPRRSSRRSSRCSRRTFGGHSLVYLDSSATSQTPQPVIDAMTSYYTHSRASIHRGVYPLAAEATDLYEGARERIASWLGSTVQETIFTANATAAINMVAYTWGRQNVQRGDLVVLTEMEHHSNIVPWQLLCQDREAELAYVPVSSDGFLDLDALDALLSRGPRLVSRRARLERARDGEPGGRDRAAGARLWGRGAGRRRTGGAAAAGVAARPRRGLLCLDRAQGVRADRDRRPARAAGAARGDAALHRWRPHDQDRRGQRVDLDRPAVEVRGRDVADRRGDRVGSGRRLDFCGWHGPDSRARAGLGGRAAGAARRLAGGARRGRAGSGSSLRIGGRWCPSPWRAPIRTTSPTSSGRWVCACGRDIIAPSR